MDEEQGLHLVPDLKENHNEAEEVMEMEEIKAALLQNGIYLDDDEKLKDLTDEEAEGELVGKEDGVHI